MSGHSDKINNGSVGRICPQAIPFWGIAAQNGGKVPSSLPPVDPRTTEDCLFLDVVVPGSILNQSSSQQQPGKGAPVLVWIYGGGYTYGEKSSYSPAGLIKASQVADPNGVIFVSLNYRLGAFGFLSGPTFQTDGTANAGLYDQRLALQWIQDRIHLFGGDPSRVTVFGESAGGGSIMHQITAFGGLKGPAPFKQALPQSPGFLLVTGANEQESTFNEFLRLLNVSSLAEARALPSEALITANSAQIDIQSPYGQFTYGPVVDGLFAPALPGQLLQRGQFDHSLNLMVGHNADEGFVFTDPRITNNTGFLNVLDSNFADLPPASLSYITQTLYPPIFDGSRGYTSQFGRVALTISEGLFSCNTNYLARAYGNNTHNYLFSVPPGIHGEDVPYTFYGGGLPNELVIAPSTATALQEYITSFAIQGLPSGPGLPVFPAYGSQAQVENLNATSIMQIRDPAANERCLWWQKGLVS